MSRLPSLVAVGVPAPGVGYPDERARRPCQAVGGWAIDQLRFGGAARGGWTRQAAALLAHAVIHPVTTVAILRTEPRVPEPTPVLNPQWAAGHTGERKRGTRDGN